MEEKIKRKFKLEENKVYSLRKLRNVTLAEFKELLIKEYKRLLLESEFNLVNRTNQIVVQAKCFDYKYTPNDFLAMKEAARVVNLKIPLYIRKNIEIFERAHFIKTVWGEYNITNARGENFKLESYE